MKIQTAPAAHGFQEVLDLGPHFGHLGAWRVILMPGGSNLPSTEGVSMPGGSF